jgi:hypothetical protein
MATMEAFDTILNWKLQRGSHTFPGQTEEPASTKRPSSRLASISAVLSLRLMPSCFSRPICRLAMLLNDEADDEQRQQLLPFVGRLACADTPKVEREREAYITLVCGLTAHSTERLEVLKGALAIGRQADVLAPDEVTTRLEAVQHMAPPKMVAHSSKLAKLKAWFAAAA